MFGVVVVGVLWGLIVGNANFHPNVEGAVRSCASQGGDG